MWLVRSHLDKFSDVSLLDIFRQVFKDHLSDKVIDTGERRG